MKLRTLLPPVLGIAGIALGVFLGRGPLAPSASNLSVGDTVIIRGNDSILNGAPIANANVSPLKDAKTPARGSAAADALLGVI
ncbi:MAG: hypothetical protein ACKVHP_01885, partial [Verrucomicrobiales bacterium]